MDMKKILQTVWLACLVGTIVLYWIVIHFNLPLSNNIISTFIILTMGYLPFTLIYKRLPEFVSKHLFILNMTLVLSIIYYNSPFVGDVIFYFIPLYAVMFIQFPYLFLSCGLAILSYVSVNLLHPELDLNFGLELVKLSIFLSFSIILFYVMRTLTQKEKTNALNTKVMHALSLLIEIKDPYTKGHSSRVADYSILLGKEAIRSGHKINLDILWTSAILHDIGKVYIPDEILLKTGKLTDEEYNTVKLHSTHGAEITEELGFPKEIVKIILHHHERQDGYGYPAKLSGTNIPLSSKLIAIADTYDALTTDRPYRQAFTPEEAKKIVLENFGSQFDPRFKEVFIKVYPIIVEKDKKAKQNMELTSKKKVFNEV